MRDELPAQPKTIQLQRIVLGKALHCRGNEIDLFEIDTAMGTGREMQANPDFGQEGKMVVQILGRTIRDIRASQSV